MNVSVENQTMGQTTRTNTVRLGTQILNYSIQLTPAQQLKLVFIVLLLRQLMEFKPAFFEHFYKLMLFYRLRICLDSPTEY